MELGERGKGKENDRASVTSYNITSVKIGEIRMCIEKCGVGGKGVKESNGRG
jgi:hypothetical protein